MKTNHPYTPCTYAFNTWVSNWFTVLVLSTPALPIVILLQHLFQPTPRSHDHLLSLKYDCIIRIVTKNMFF